MSKFLLFAQASGYHCSMRLPNIASFAFLLGLAISFAAAPAQAVLYKYKDDKGSLHVVDSEDAIPEKYRNKTVKLKGSSGSGRVYGDNPCIGKKLCAVIYVAPWCPECKKMLPTYKKYIENNSATSDYGIMMLVGKERKMGHNSEVAQKFGYGALEDPTGGKADEYGVRAYPTTVVVDELGRVKLRDGDASGWVTKNFAGTGGGGQGGGPSGFGGAPPGNNTGGFIPPPGAAGNTGPAKNGTAGGPAPASVNSLPPPPAGLQPVQDTKIKK